MPAPQQHQPWPMKWIVLAIFLLIVPYTVLTLRYRKTAPAFQPYEDMKTRVNVSRLLAAGYQRIPLTAERPAEGARAAGGATVLPDVGGLPADLRATLVEVPMLAAEILNVIAPPAANTRQPYVIQLTCTLPDAKHQLRGAELYVQGQTAVILPTFEPSSDGLASRSREATVVLTIPTSALKPGQFMMTLVGERASRSWPIEVH